jgi:hypothetical protein
MKMMFRKSACLLGMLSVAALIFFTSFKASKPAVEGYSKHYYYAKIAGNTNSSLNKYGKLYDSMKLSMAGLTKQAFDYAVKGYNYLVATGKIKNDGILSIIDFTLPSSYKRLFVIDLNTCSMLFNTYVAHGRNSGKALANEFSNDMNSFKSSLGFYVTSGTYKGKHGYSLRLEGQEQGINDNALNRGIVMHCALYVSEQFIKNQGYIGRSEGCPAVPVKMYKPIIQKIKDGSCLFMYSPDAYYMSHSLILNNKGLA